jgi:hypothetical protein
MMEADLIFSGSDGWINFFMQNKEWRRWRMTVTNVKIDTEEFFFITNERDGY